MSARFRPSPESEGARRPGKITVEVAQDLLEQVRDAVVYLSGPPHRMTMRSLVEGALERELQRLSDELVEGQPFPRREHELRAGRPLR